MIPRIIHQTWRDLNVPERWQEFQRSWRAHHPDWEYRLWTDPDLRSFVGERYPWFLPVYDGYPHPIQRADAARYFLMHSFGGVYADLDYECLRPIGPLLEGRELVLGREPEAHLAKPVVRAHGLDEVYANAFLASRPEHPFWERVFLELVGSHQRPGPLDSTGPFLLTRAVKSFPKAASLTCLGSAELYPGSSLEAEKGSLSDPRWRSRNATEAYGIHHWSGSWFERAEANEAARTLAFTVTERGKAAFQGSCAEGAGLSALSLPKVSALLVTRDTRLELARQSIACFEAQTYPEKELVIVDDGETGELGRYLWGLRSPSLRYVKLASANATLGALRNTAVREASGEYVIQWDDDDLYSPRRISSQMQALRAARADACFLSRWRIWWPRERRLAVSKRRAWEGSILCAKDALPPYDERLRRGEDTPVTLKLASRGRVAYLDAPWLYTYRVHGGNTTPSQGLADHWAQATEFSWGERYADSLRRAASELPEPVREELEREAKEASADRARTASVSIPGWKPESRKGESLPKVLILTPVKDGAPFVRSYVEGLQRLSYPRERISVALLESDSDDGTFHLLAEALEALRPAFARVELLKRDYRLRLPGNRAGAEKQLRRRSVLARSRNYLLSRALESEDWVLWLDFDVIEYPADVIQALLASGKEIVAPHCVLAPGGRTFDLNTFVQDECPDEYKDEGDEPIFQPPKGLGRRYLDSMRDLDLVEVDAVGGTMLLVKADLHREGLVFPAAPYKRHIETEGLSFLGRDLGIRSWGMPKVEVVHADR